MSSYHVDTLQSTISKNHPVQFDKNGVPKAKIPYTKNFQYHVTDIASYAIMNEHTPKIFNAQINWLIKYIEPDGAYQHHFKFPFYKNFPSPWIGGLAQGLAISALCIAYKRKKEEEILNTAKKAFTCLKKECTIKDGNNTWIEEYPLKLHILNGFIYAIFGVYDINEITHMKTSNDLFNQCIQTLENTLKDYDLGYWSRYSLHGSMPSTFFYHTLHIKQLNALYKITKNDLFLSYANKWSKYPLKKSNQIKVKTIRTITHLKKHGIYGSYKRFNQRRSWLQSK
jgi:heparosan-N-sulfate-glucuronate 5-epimerase